ncbi:MAG: gliding motility protein GldN [Flavobacteriales bacterium]|jgi:gliding motility associated protien GldN|nr:gliding motility protein GldN [Flavobacteriales bacterium]
MKKRLVILSVIVAFVTTLTIEGVAQNVLDGVYVKEHYPTRKVIPYTHLREADVMWSTRIWRKLDLREKINQPLYYPTESIKNRRSLTQVMIEAVREGSLTAYDPLDDEFTMTLTKAEIERKLMFIDTLYIESPDPPYELQMQVVEEPFNPANVKEIRLKEDWFFDRQKSILDVRIIGIQPVADNIDRTTGEVRGKEPMFWVYFPEARNIFASAEVFNRQNDAERRTMEDIFWKRMFGSYIYKEKNVYDRLISDYMLNGIDQLLEAEKIKEQIFILEHDLWEY